GLDALNVKLRRRFIRIKHHSELIEAYECDPFVTDFKKRDDAIAAFREFLGTTRKETRWPVPKGTRLDVKTDHGEGYLADFSESGFSVILNNYHGAGVTLS